MSQHYAPRQMNQSRSDRLHCGFNPQGKSYKAYVEHIEDCPDSMCQRRRENRDSMVGYFARKYGRSEPLDHAFARNNGDVLVRVVAASEWQQRLMLLLREPRTVNELRAANLELNLDAELKELATQGYATLDKQNRWKLTDEGLERVKARK